MSSDSPVRVFISYAYEHNEYRLWVRRLATRLRQDGIDARLDYWHLLDGDSIPQFMNREVRHADKVLVLCSPMYRAKVHAAEDGNVAGGSAWEFMLLTSEKYAGEARDKIVPVLARGAWHDSAPSYLESFDRIKLNDPSKFEGEYRRLLQRLTGKQEKAPDTGSLPGNIELKAVEPLVGHNGNKWEIASDASPLNQAENSGKEMSSSKTPRQVRQSPSVGSARAKKKRYLAVILLLLITLGTTILFLSLKSWDESSNLEIPIPGPSTTSEITWILFKGGSFVMGNDDNGPIHEETVSSFEMSRSEITVMQYRACVNAGKCLPPDTGSHCNWSRPGADDYPVNCVSWFQAETFTEWKGEGVRLPTEAEWEYAATGGGQSLPYPWGSEPPRCGQAAINFDEPNCHKKESAKICSGSQSEQRDMPCDMIGNLWEWCDDWFSPYTRNSQERDVGNSQDSDGSDVEKIGKVIRGGSWISRASEIDGFSRNYRTPYSKRATIGFRIVKPLAPFSPEAKPSR